MPNFCIDGDGRALERPPVWRQIAVVFEELAVTVLAAIALSRAARSRKRHGDHTQVIVHPVA